MFNTTLIVAAVLPRHPKLAQRGAAQLHEIWSTSSIDGERRGNPRAITPSWTRQQKRALIGLEAAGVADTAQNERHGKWHQYL